MQYIQLQGQVAAGLDLPLEGSYNLFIDTSDNSIKAKDSDGHLHGGGGLSLTELTRDELGQLVASASLTPGAFYKITGAASQSFLDAREWGYSGYGNEIQKGGTTIILQAATDATLSKKGIGLFYVPNYENPNQLTAPPDYNYLTWDNTHRLYFYDVNGTLAIGDTVTLYSDDTENSTTAYLEGSLEGSGSGNVTLRLGNNDTFFENPNNLNQLQLQAGSVSGSYDGYDYTSSYAPGDCVIFGGRVWQNLSGSIGYREGGNQWPTNVLNLNEEDWAVVPFNETNYTLQAHTIEYEFEYDNISYRSDGTNEVRCQWDWITDSYGYNTIAYFPWGHYGVERVSFTNTYLHHFVNFPWQCAARDIKFEHNGLFNATTWGRQSYFNRIHGAVSAEFGSNRFSTGTDIWDITLGIDAEFRNIRTAANCQIYNITLGSNASFYGVDMYYSSEIYNVEIGTDAYFGNSYHYEWSNVFDVELGINAYLQYFTLRSYSEIKAVTIGANSYMRNFDLAYSSCLKRTTLASDAYISYFDIGVNSFIRQVNLSDRAYITSFEIGDNANLQNIDLGAYAYMSNFGGGTETDFQDIRLDARAYINNVYLGYGGTFSQIQIAPNGYFSSVNDSFNPSPFTGSYISGITIEPHSYITSIEVGSDTMFKDIYIGTNSSAGEFTLEEGSNISDINLIGNAEFGGILVCSGSEITDFQVGMSGGFGAITITGSAALSNFEIGQYMGFGGETFTSSINNVAITKGFSNLYNNATFTGVSGSQYDGNQNNLPYLNIDSRGVVLLDITDFPAETVNYRLDSGDYEGQEIKFVVKNSSMSVLPEPTDVRVWCNDLQYPFGLNPMGYAGNASFAPFAHYHIDGWVWRTMGRAIWTNGMWVTDAEYYYD